MAESHPEEIARLTGNTNGDEYVAWVQRTSREVAAYKHLSEGLGRLNATNAIMDVRVRRLYQEARWIERGFGDHNSTSGECDCPGDRDEIPTFEGRCTGCGANLYEDRRRYRIEVAS